MAWWMSGGKGDVLHMKRILCFLSSLAFCMAASIMLDVFPLWHSFLAAAAMMWLANKYKREYSVQYEWSRLLCAAFFSLLFGLAYGIGRQVVFKGFRCDMHQNYITIDSLGIFTGILVSLVIFPAVLCAIGFITSHDLLCANHTTSHRKVFFISWATISALWLPYLLTYSPGGIVGDGAHTLEDAIIGGAPRTNHWSVAYILVLRFFLYLGSLISDRIQTGVYLWVVFATVAIAAVFALVAATLWRKGAPCWLVVSTVVMYAFCGFFASYGMSLWKDGTFGAGIVLLSLMLWDFADAERTIGKRDIIRFTVLGLFLCLWRSNGPFLLAPTLLGMALLLRKRAKTLLVAGMLVIVFSAILTGPIYRACGIGSDSLRESISIPTQQLAAVINHNRSLTDSQKAILFDILPEETWRKYYFPGISDDLKVQMDNQRISSQLPGMLKVWAQLLPSNFRLYVETYLMQTIGFWRPFCWRGLFYDYWVGIQDLHYRRYSNDDYILRLTGYDLKPILKANMRFVSSGTMVWILFFAGLATLCRQTGRAMRLLPLLPLLAGWAAIMVATPMAFFYRYVVFIPMALPIILTIPFGDEKSSCHWNDAQDGALICNKSRLLSAVFFFFSLVALATAVLQKSDKVARLSDKSLDIWLYGENYNATHYISSGISGPEHNGSWTSGTHMDVEIPVKSSCMEYDVRIVVRRPFYGRQRWIARQKDAIIAQGALESAGDVRFSAAVANGKLGFSIEFPDAKRPSEVYPDSKDYRKIAMQIERIRIGPRKVK